MRLKHKPNQLKRKRFDKRVIPNLLTVINMFLGFFSIGLLISGRPVHAGWIILIAGAFDAVDGKIARLLNIPSRFGTEFDSFADTISFCASPSLLIYTVYVHGMDPLLGGLISFIPLMFGTIRLARFNIDYSEKQTFFTGLPTPVNALSLYGFMLFHYQLNGTMGDPRVILVLMVILSFLMISPLRFNKLPLLSFKKGKTNSIRLIGLAILIFTLLLWKGLILFPFLMGYIIYNIMNWVIKNRLTASEIKDFKNQADLIE
ncbi:MAG: CDP-diacylglycerol--serine O-phosphatidyltransferase [Candidatus Marinimicrobia bacterium]|nr:CDP-diacylglycerol--serine O-phosphatidyltransferase [Candidatus Neomarinimicrobiota bacterium]